MKKIYSSPAARFTINVKKDGKPLAISFDRYDPDSKRRWIVVEDPEIMEQLDNSKDKDVYFTCDRVVEEEQAETIPPSKLLEFVTEPDPEIEVSNKIVKKDLAEGKRWLNSIGVSYSKMKSKAIVINLAREQGYELSFESDNK